MLVAIIIAAFFFIATLYAIITNSLDGRRERRVDIEGIAFAYVSALILSIVVALMLPNIIVGFGSNDYEITEKQVTGFVKEADGHIMASTADGDEYDLEQADISLVMQGDPQPVLVEKKYYNPLMGATYRKASVSNGTEQAEGEGL